MKKELLQKIGIGIFWLLCWQGLALLVDNSILLVGPYEMWLTLIQLFSQGEFWLSIGNSLLRIGAGFLLASFFGILWGGLASKSRFVSFFLSPLVSLMKTIPVASFVILAIIWLGGTRNLSVFVSFVVVFPMVYLSTLSGIRSTDRKLLEEVEKAAKIANADSFIRRLPQGYDTMVTADGANLSQGQRQLLAIARAAVADPPVLILDEATSSIDTRTEALIEKGMDQLMEGRTVFVIVHRLSTVRNADAIMVLEQGQIVERGSHEDLLAQQGEYYQLYNGMFELS